MNKERELLIQALEDWDFSDKLETLDPIFEDIRTHLSTSDDADNPVAWMFQHEDTGLIDYVDTQQVEWGFEKNNPRWQKIGPVFLHPPRPAEPEAETIETLKAENFKLASGQCTEGGPWGDEGGTPYCKYAARKPMTNEEIIQGVTVDTSDDFHAGYWAGIRFAEKHHGIGGGE